MTPIGHHILNYYKLSQNMAILEGRRLVGFTRVLRPTFFYILWEPRIAIWLSMCCTFLVSCSKGGWLATQSTLPGSAPEHFPIPIFSLLPHAIITDWRQLEEYPYHPHPPPLGKYCPKPPSQNESTSGKP